MRRFTLSDLYEADPNAQSREKRFQRGTVVGFDGGIAEVDVGATLPNGVSQHLMIQCSAGFSPVVGQAITISYANDSVHSGYAVAAGDSAIVAPTGASHGLLEHTDAATYLNQPLLTTSDVVHGSVTPSNLTPGKIPIASAGGKLVDGQTPLAGTKVYYVADSSGGVALRKLTFIDGILCQET